MLASSVFGIIVVVAIGLLFIGTGVFIWFDDSPYATTITIGSTKTTKVAKQSWLGKLLMSTVFFAFGGLLVGVVLPSKVDYVLGAAIGLILFFGGGLTEILVGVKMWRDPGWWARRQAASDGNEGININLELSQEGLAQAAVGKVGAAVIYPHRRVLATCLIALGLAFWAALGFAVHRLLH